LLPVKVALSDAQNTGAVFVGIEKITHLLPRCAIYENLYIGVNPQPRNAKAIERTLIELYTSILVFLVWARRHFDQNLALRTARGIFATETAQSLLNSIDGNDSSVRKEANLADAEYHRCASRNLAQLITDHGTKLRDILGELEMPILRIELAVTAIYEDLQESKRNTILQWLSSTPYPQHHENVQEGILENSGEWLLQHETFRRWQTSTASTILWLHGIPGAGKTKLTSVVLDNLLNPLTIASRNNGKAVAYFYCNRNEPQRQNPEVILRTIIQQLSSYGNTGLPKCVVSKYKERNKNGVALGPPLFHDSLNLLIEILDIHSSTVIVIDALDEIDSKFRRQDFLQALKHIISASRNLVKLFVASRDDTDISLALDNVPNLYINAEDNKDDIERFIKHEVARSITQGKLLQGKVSDQLREHIISTLIKKAGGMY
jgi:Cdc6-like AAA superfamily ATPase